MSLKSEPYYWLVCDECGERADYDEFSAFEDVGQAYDRALDLGWTSDGERDHCENCPTLTKCDHCGGKAGPDADERDNLCAPCWAALEAEDAAAAPGPSSAPAQGGGGNG